jgi:hypothetical protein
MPDAQAVVAETRILGDVATSEQNISETMSPRGSFRTISFTHQHGIIVTAVNGTRLWHPYNVLQRFRASCGIRIETCPNGY